MCSGFTEDFPPTIDQQVTTVIARSLARSSIPSLGQDNLLFYERVRLGEGSWRGRHSMIWEVRVRQAVSQSKLKPRLCRVVQPSGPKIHCASRNRRVLLHFWDATCHMQGSSFDQPRSGEFYHHLTTSDN